MTREQALALERGDLVLDVESGELLEFLWEGGPAGEDPLTLQLRPMLDRGDYKRVVPFRNAIGGRYQRL